MDYSSIYFILQGCILFLLFTLKSWCLRLSAAFLTFPFISCSPFLLVFSSPVASLYSYLLCSKPFFTSACTSRYFLNCLIFVTCLQVSWERDHFNPEIAVAFLMDRWVDTMEKFMVGNSIGFFGWLERKRDVRNLSIWREGRCWTENVKIPF